MRLFALCLIAACLHVLGVPHGPLRGGDPGGADDPVAASDPESRPDIEPVDPELILIGTMRGRGFAVHIWSGGRYSVEDDMGEVLGALLTEEEFAEQFPEMHDFTQTMLAGEAIADNPRDFASGRGDWDR